MFLPLLSLLFACGEGPLFTDIQGIEVQVVSPNGLKRTHLEQAGLTKGINCLYQTSGATKADTEKRQLLQTAYLVLVRDANGVRNFEMITDRHLKGNKERYYTNSCIHEILQEYGPKDEG